MSSKISIILPTFNRAHLIEDMLVSIQNQTYKDFECLIVDDGSSDNTEIQISPFLSDNRFRYKRRSNNYASGLPGARNCGIDWATGDFIIFFDDDDIVHPDNLKITVRELCQSRSSFCISGRETFEGEFDKSFSTENEYKLEKIDGITVLPKLVKEEFLLNSTAVLWDKNCFENIRFEESLMYAEDWECYSRILSQGFSGIKISKTLYYGRKHKASNTGEYYSGSPFRKKSKIKAALLIIENLKKKNLLSIDLIKHFNWLSVLLKSYDLHKKILEQVESLSLKTILKIKYHFSFLFIELIKFKKILKN
ncbi:glycosyltransferase family 2 protein [Leeuwenhoekiella sp. W20_SRS_FM14]|uniref:glycosyltransferase family 2 protein n=1 Tax=Leeuwenhoekiella sp. W20_SRS_FM14 TaxID=3240270 RepID=UPI003F9BE5F4